MACALAFGSDDFKTKLIMTEVSNNANVTVIKCALIWTDSWLVWGQRSREFQHLIPFCCSLRDRDEESALIFLLEILQDEILHFTRFDAL